MSAEYLFLEAWRHFADMVSFSIPRQGADKELMPRAKRHIGFSDVHKHLSHYFYKQQAFYVSDSTNDFRDQNVTIIYSPLKFLLYFIGNVQIT
jgi:hypothetical protein